MRCQAGPSRMLLQRQTHSQLRRERGHDRTTPFFRTRTGESTNWHDAVIRFRRGVRDTCVLTPPCAVGASNVPSTCAYVRRVEKPPCVAPTFSDTSGTVPKNVWSDLLRRLWPTWRPDASKTQPLSVRLSYSASAVTGRRSLRDSGNLFQRVSPPLSRDADPRNRHDARQFSSSAFEFSETRGLSGQFLTQTRRCSRTCRLVIVDFVSSNTYAERINRCVLA